MKISDLRKLEIIVGFPRGKTFLYPPDDRKGRKSKGGQSVAQVATWNEFGTKKTPKHPGIPSRPFLRTALKENRTRIKEAILKYYLGKTNAEAIGVMLVSLVVKSIRTGVWEPNTDVTKRIKKSSKPLIDRSHMVTNVHYEIISQ